MSSITETAAMMKKVNIFFIFSHNNSLFPNFLLFKGLFAIQATKLEPKSCSQRVCYYKDTLLFTTWISSKVSEKDLQFDVSGVAFRRVS